mmetsp:Transcript_49329/g.81139  ORF Transcript_49329/g.81139 Transcript_49329/m.81139 type:complete len:85 (-) Transcript_49329:571-825(-)
MGHQHNHPTAKLWLESMGERMDQTQLRTWVEKQASSSGPAHQATTPKCTHPHFSAPLVANQSVDSNCISFQFARFVLATHVNGI